MKAVVCERWGEPAEVLQVRDVPDPTPGRGQVLVRMLAAPINPSDLFMVRGVYGKQPPLPCVPGFEGVGIVEKGSAPLSWIFGGKRVAVLNGGAGSNGNWAEKVVIPAIQAVPVPDSMSDEQAASFFVNPASAVAMVRHVLRVPRGAWLLQTAAGSALGRMIIRMGTLDGFRTINVVRRWEQVAELKAIGATEVIATDRESMTERVKEITKGAGVPCAIDAVAGATGSEAVACLGRHGRLLIYSSLSGQPLTLDPRTLLAGEKRVEGFWLSEWIAEQGNLTKLFLFSKLRKLIGQGVLDTNPGTMFPLDQVAEAVKLADQTARKGKVLLRIGTR
jgi:NADPH:quinone reductase-like Zn-dependent oxidoreductase